LLPHEEWASKNKVGRQIQSGMRCGLDIDSSWGTTVEPIEVGSCRMPHCRRDALILAIARRAKRVNAINLA
jgi:hypothetical protein